MPIWGARIDGPSRSLSQYLETSELRQSYHQSLDVPWS